MARAHFTLWEILERQGKYAELEEAALGALAVRPDHPDAQARLARARALASSPPAPPRLIGPGSSGDRRRPTTAPSLPGARGSGSLGQFRGRSRMARLPIDAIERLMAERLDGNLEAALDVFEVFASGSLTDEVYILEDVGGKRIAIAPTAFKERYRRR